MNVFEPISSNDILNKIDTNIIFYDDLFKYSNIEQMLKNDSCVLLYKSQPAYGHWVCLIRNKYGIEFFDSYGKKPDEQKENINKDFLKLSNQYRDYLLDILIDASYKYPIFYNEYKYQRKNVSTCGKHCVIRIIMKHLDTKSYNLWLHSLNMDIDVIVDYLYNQIK